MKVVRGLSGIVAAGIVVLTLVVIGAMLIGDRRGFPGPGAEAVFWHIAGAVTAVVAQLYSDRRTGLPALAAALLVFVVGWGLLWTQWWG